MASARSLMRLGTGRSLASAARSSRMCRPFSTTPLLKESIPEPPNMRQAQRPPEGALRAPVVNPADKYQDKADALHQYGQYIMSCLPKYVQQFTVWKDELVVYVPPSGVIPLMSFLKYHTAAEFTQISDITAVDFPTKDQRFEVVYNMLSVRHNSRIRVKTYADEATPVPSVTGLFEGALWYEREVYDMFGVFFTGHPDLRRIMTDYGFDGHPLRKDFPLTGYTELRYDEEKKRIVIEPLELTQAFRNFEGGSAAWEPVGPGEDRTPASLSDVDSGPKRTYNVQTMRLTQKFEQGVVLLSRALKVAKGFERQKLSRREKTAKSQGSSEALQKIAEEIEFIKSLDPTATAQKYLFKQLFKTKRISEAPAFIQFKESKNISAEGPRSTAEANVTARLYKSNPVKNAFPNIMTDIKKLLGVEDVAGGKKEKSKEAGSKENAPKTKTEQRAVSVSDSEPEDPRIAAAVAKFDEEEGEEGEESEEGDEVMSDAESIDFAQFDSRLAPGSEDEDEDGADGAASDDDGSDGGVSLKAPSDMSISRSPSPDSPPAKKAKSSKTLSAPATSTTFLPSLTMGGYFSGSESEPEDIEGQQPRRKNRMGQQARRALWEKKYGSGANHVKQQQNQQKRSRDNGWDMRRGATDGSEGPRGRRGQGRGARPQYGGDRPQRGPPVQRRKPEDDKPLHPSWEAAKRAKEQKVTAAFQGKKVTFD
ncbi:BUD22-domain-containing protein [Aspergillus pseudonomiae]|uniref:BUD22-domain-containing protein n=1 Tax=Aspergillus pseudonomiae TaxID=1506151 RepID=A0A5N7DFJ0_9EURO|nr:BUD22-domain-containing protein [Aspergillus pseudonomiae]KAE8405216.1 BUD22-domain-containing protein [Aspergillus pseudonomiae]